jgi:hypothetical protein
MKNFLFLLTIILVSLTLFHCCLMVSNNIPAINNPHDAMSWANNAITYDKSMSSHWPVY